jgi:multidrug efflux pump subunit AcrA (membrane-fusion protein)
MMAPPSALVGNDVRTIIAGSRVDNRRPLAVKWTPPTPATTGGRNHSEGRSMTFENAIDARPARRAVSVLVIGAAVLLLPGCGKDDKKDAARPPLEVTAFAIVPRDVPVTSVFVAQTQSSQAVNIAARVSGFLDKRVYTEGAVVKAGQVLFRMDQKPFQAQVDGQAAALQRSQAALEVAAANLKRTKPLAEQNALSQKDLDDAQGQYEQAQAAVAQGKASSRSEAQPLVHDDHVARRRCLELRCGRRRHVRQSQNTASSPPSRC